MPSDRQGLATPAVTLPKGGGALRGIGEKFAANPVSGTGSLTVPILTSPARSGFAPQLTLAYDSGAGNGPFGWGWTLALPSIARKTETGLPIYKDADESDVFLLSGAEDLVPVLVEHDGGWSRESRAGAIDGRVYTVDRYRPRIEGAFARIERWTNRADRSDVCWRTITPANVTTWFGKTPESRVVDPLDASRIFSWLVSESYDDRGNAILYSWIGEDSAGLEPGLVHERNRTARSRRAARYLKRVRYSNRVSRLVAPDLAVASWMFEVVFDYDEGHYEAIDAPLRRDAEHEAVRVAATPGRSWRVRPDPFSSYRSGFDVRTYRRCRRALMFHAFDALGADPYLVRSTEFEYADFDYAAAGDIAAELAHDGSTRSGSFITTVTQSGYIRDPADVLVRDGVRYLSYLKKSLPPLQLEYTRPHVQDAVRELAVEAADNLPIGVDGWSYRWLDLDGEGLSGVLTEQADGWFYKANLGEGRFGSLEALATRPSLADLSANRQQFLDLTGDGRLELVTFDGQTPGFQERTADRGWSSFRTFRSLPNVKWDDPNLRFIDLDGDGRVDVLLTESDALTCYQSLGADGYGPAHRISTPLDDENGARLVFEDGTASVYLADMSGDGLSDLVRITNGEVSYWPNLGGGRFGAKITMDDAPAFDRPERFDQRRIRLADIDGSGASDIIYLGPDGARLYFNQSGNRWSRPRELPQFPNFDDLSRVMVADLLGNGTACLVWSSTTAERGRPALRFIDLMGGQKPHLLATIRNNLGATTEMTYAPSTSFYVADRAAGKPWVTKLPFPVHCVARVTVRDAWRQTTFSTTYSYHHGYFDGVEREFRGFGRVEQTDVESYGQFAGANAASPFITADRTLYQPPVKTVTWYHTGTATDRDRILSQFAHEQFPHSVEGVQVVGGFKEPELPPPDLNALSLSAEEWREAARACKGTMLRQETFELDVAALEHGAQRPVRLCSTVSRTCEVRRVQPAAGTRHPVFLVVESESLACEHDLDLRPAAVEPDPRVTQSFNLTFDEHGRVLQSVASVGPRVGRFEEAQVAPADLAAIRRVQQERHISYTEMRYTNDIDEADDLRLRVPCEVSTHELTGVEPSGSVFTLAELRGFRLSTRYQAAGRLVAEIAYHALASPGVAQKRLVQQTRMLFFKDDDAAIVDPLPFGTRGRLGLAFETYTLAMTDDLLAAILGAKLDAAARAMLSNAAVSGYLSGAPLAARFPGADTAGQYWTRSGIVGYAADASTKFYQPTRFVDPFGNTLSVEYDPLTMFVQSTSDPLGNTTRVRTFDFRVLAPREIQDINDNISEAVFDIFGLPTATALEGKGADGDHLAGFEDRTATPSRADLTAFFTAPAYDEDTARLWLATATARHIYHFGERRNPDGTIVWAEHPACACRIVRERHVSQLAAAERSPIQSSFEYSDGLGGVIVKKVQAEPETAAQPLRWVATGKTILNNKGAAVKQYQPYFSAAGHRFEEAAEIGVTPIMYYDALGRPIRTESPDGSYSRVEYSPWHASTYDPNDTVLEPGNAWFARNSASASADDRRAAQLASEHAATPSLTIFDSLGRPCIAIAHNRTRTDDGSLVDEAYATFTNLDAEGKALWIRDARRNLVVQSITPPVPANQAADPVNGFVPAYDVAGRRLFMHSAEAGDSWSLPDAAGAPMLGWDAEGRALRVDFDRLRRPIASFIVSGDPLQPGAIQFEKVIYGDAAGNGLTDAQKTALNMRGRVYRQCDTAGVIVSAALNPATGALEGFDFKGNLLRSEGQLLTDYRSLPDWSGDPVLGVEKFRTSTRYDALDRPTRIIPGHSDAAGATLSVIQPRYSAAGLLDGVDVWLEQASEPVGQLDPATASRHIVSNIDRDAKGQRQRVEYGAGAGRTVATYSYDPQTLRVTRAQTVRPDHPDPAKRTLQDASYTYDPVGNITRVLNQAQDRVFHTNACVVAGAEHRYDALYRLAASRGREHRGGDQQPDWDEGVRMQAALPNDCQALRNYVETYQYDGVGNIVRMRHHEGGDIDAPGAVVWNRRYQYAQDSNRLIATRLPADPDNLPTYAAAAGYTARYTYDTRGNIASMPHLPSISWNAKGELRATSRQVVNGGAPETTFYVYSASGQRVRKVTERSGRRTEERIYFGSFEVYRRYAADGGTIALERETLHVADDVQTIALVETRTRAIAPDPAPRQVVRYQHGDHLGSSVVEVDDDADVISYEEYNPFGSTAYQTRRSTNETPKRYRYTGKERDEESGLTHHGARYCASWLGRWISCDPAGLIDGPNLYAYARNNPVRLSDPTGRQAKYADEWGTFNPEFTHSDQDITGVHRGTGSVKDLAKPPPPQASLSGPSTPARPAAPKRAAASRPAAPRPARAPVPAPPTPDADGEPEVSSEPAAPALPPQQPPPEPTHEFGFYPFADAEKKLDQSAKKDFKEGHYLRGIGKYLGTKALSPFMMAEDLAIWNWPDHFLSAGQYAKRWIWYDMRGQSGRGLLELFKGHMEAASIVGSFEIISGAAKTALTGAALPKGALAKEAEAGVPALAQRGEQLFNELGASMIKNPTENSPNQLRRWLTIAITEPTGGGGMRIVTVQNPTAHRLLSSGQVRLLPNEVLGPAPFNVLEGEAWLMQPGRVHAEISGVWTAMAMEAEGGWVWTSNPACAHTCDPLFRALTNWRHLNLRP